MFSVTMILAVLALGFTIVSIFGKCPLWIAVLLLSIIALVQGKI